MDKKLKKKLLLERNKRQQLIIQHAEQHQRERDLEQERQEAEMLAATETSRAATNAQGEVVWSAKTQEIRNRLTNKKRMAMSRWGKFAGTSDAGSMGR